MTYAMALFTFLNAWFVSLFFVAPFVVRARKEDGAEMGYVAAPAAINWKKFLLINTAVAAVATAILAILINSGAVPLHNWL